MGRREKSGYLVKYTDASGNIQKGIVRHKEQTVEVISKSKVLVRLLTDDFHPKKDEGGKEMTVLKSKESVVIIGFSD